MPIPRQFYQAAGPIDSLIEQIDQIDQMDSVGDSPQFIPSQTQLIPNQHHHLLANQQHLIQNPQHLLPSQSLVQTQQFTQTQQLQFTPNHHINPNQQFIPSQPLQQQLVPEKLESSPQLAQKIETTQAQVVNLVSTPQFLCREPELLPQITKSDIPPSVVATAVVAPLEVLEDPPKEIVKEIIKETPIEPTVEPTAPKSKVPVPSKVAPKQNAKKKKPMSSFGSLSRMTSKWSDQASQSSQPSQTSSQPSQGESASQETNPILSSQPQPVSQPIQIQEPENIVQIPQSDPVEEEPKEAEDELLSSDSQDSDGPEQVLAQSNIQDEVVCTFTLVKRTKNKWKFSFKNGVAHIHGKDYLFATMTGEGEW